MTRQLYYPVIFPGDEIEILIDKTSFRYALIKARTERHLTQKELSDISSLSTKCISDIENVGNPTLKSIIKYLDALGYQLSIQKKQY